MYLISIYGELFRFKEDKVEIEDTATDSDMPAGKGNCLSGDTSIIGAYEKHGYNVYVNGIVR